MAINQTQKLIWLVNTILNAKKIDLKGINDHWQDEMFLNDGSELPRRTFNNWKDKIFDMFGLEIKCDSSYQYYISNADDLKENSMAKWLLDTYSISNSLSGCTAIKDRIILENIPSGKKYLNLVIEAMKKNQRISIKYHNYWRDDIRDHDLMPLCVKLFHQRWYMVGRENGMDKSFCLDRIHEFSLSDETFEYPADFSPEDYFSNCIGIINNQDIEPEDIELWVSSEEANYIRDLPLHESQKEIERNDDYSLFTIRVRPTYDFYQEILTFGDQVEIQKPEDVREKMKLKAINMANKYKQQHNK